MAHALALVMKSGFRKGNSIARVCQIYQNSFLYFSLTVHRQAQKVSAMDG